LGNSLITRLQSKNFTTNEEMRDVLNPCTTAGSGDWTDLAGLLCPAGECENILTEIENGTLTDMETLNSRWSALHRTYYEYEWTWALSLLEQWTGKTRGTLTAAHLINVVEHWKEAVLGIDNMLYEDAKKEFLLTCNAGACVDNGDSESDIDFASVQDDFETQDIIKTIHTHQRVKAALGEEVIGKLRLIDN
jgi:hypothetical protein